MQHRIFGLTQDGTEGQTYSLLFQKSSTASLQTHSEDFSAKLANRLQSTQAMSQVLCESRHQETATYCQFGREPLTKRSGRNIASPRRSGLARAAVHSDNAKVTPTRAARGRGFRRSWTRPQCQSSTGMVNNCVAPQSRRPVKRTDVADHQHRAQQRRLQKHERRRTRRLSGESSAFDLVKLGECTRIRGW